MNREGIEQFLPKHLCVTCKFSQKCRRTKGVHEQLSEVESDALERWKLNVDVEYTITDCDMYVTDWDNIEVEVVYVSDDEADDGEGMR